MEITSVDESLGALGYLFVHPRTFRISTTLFKKFTNNTAQNGCGFSSSQGCCSLSIACSWETDILLVGLRILQLLDHGLALSAGRSFDRLAHLHCISAYPRLSTCQPCVLCVSPPSWNCSVNGANTELVIATTDYFARSLGFTQLTLGLIVVCLTGAVPLTSLVDSKSVHGVHTRLAWPQTDHVLISSQLPQMPSPPSPMQ